MAKGTFSAGGDARRKGWVPTPKTDGRHNGGNPPGCMTFIGFMVLLGLAVAVLLVYVNTSG